jgi:hypothetical protein
MSFSKKNELIDKSNGIENSLAVAKNTAKKGNIHTKFFI